MPTSETQAVNASVPTTGDQGQVMSKMIYLHVTKPHSLTQIAICSKTKCTSMEEQGTATVLSCEGWEPGTRLGRRWGLAQGCCKAKTLSFICDNLRLAGGWIQVRTISPICVGWKLQTSPCIDALMPGTHTHHTPSPWSSKIQLQQPVTCQHLTCCYTLSQDPNAMQLKSWFCSSAVPDVRFLTHLTICSMLFLPGSRTDLQSQVWFQSSKQNSLLSFPKILWGAWKKHYFCWSYYSHSASEGKHRHCPLRQEN